MLAARSNAIAQRVSAPRTVSRVRVVSVRAGNIIETAKAKGFTSFVAAVESAGLTSTLTDPTASFTVFVPTNTAFSLYDAKDPHTKKDIALKDTLLVSKQSTHNAYEGS